MEEKKKVRIFYSWQSDLDDKTNRAAIRKALKQAAIEIEASLGNIEIEIDEATRGLPGAPNIPMAILEKISNSHIFIADITTINAGSAGKTTPNPNVVFELGFAVCNLGWDRTILLFNEAIGKLGTDVPFDFDKHRITPFSFSTEPSAKQMAAFVKTLSFAITTIVKIDPPRPKGKFIAEDVKRQRDVSNMVWLLSALHLPTVDFHARNGISHFDPKVLHFWEDFLEIFESSMFYLHDEVLAERVQVLKEAFQASVSHGTHYDPGTTGRIYKFSPNANMAASEREALIANMEEERVVLGQALSALLNVIRSKYLEIDTDVTTETAWKRYKQMTEEQKKYWDGNDGHS